MRNSRQPPFQVDRLCLGILNLALDHDLALAQWFFSQNPEAFGLRVIVLVQGPQPLGIHSAYHVFYTGCHRVLLSPDFLYLGYNYFQAHCPQGPNAYQVLALAPGDGSFAEVVVNPNTRHEFALTPRGAEGFYLQERIVFVLDPERPRICVSPGLKSYSTTTHAHTLHSFWQFNV